MASHFGEGCAADTLILEATLIPPEISRISSTPMAMSSRPVETHSHKARYSVRSAVEVFASTISAYDRCPRSVGPNRPEGRFGLSARWMTIDSSAFGDRFSVFGVVTVRSRAGGGPMGR
jgi:hypothetical protein